MRSPGPARAAVFLACPVAGGASSWAWLGTPGIGVLYGLLLGIGAVLALEKATARDHHRKMQGRPLSNPEHRLVLAGAACLIEELGWSPAAPHGRSDNHRSGICTLAAIQRSAGLLMQAGVVTNPRAADDTNAAYGDWLDAHGHSRYGWTTHDNPRFFNDEAAYSDQYVIGLARQAAAVPPGERAPVGFLGPPTSREWGPMFDAASRQAPNIRRHGGVTS